MADLSNLRVTALSKKHKKHTTWPVEKRIEVVSQYLVLGNMALVAAVTGVNHNLIRAWKGQPWWKEFENQVRATENLQMDTKLSQIVDKSLDAVMDRVEHGDFIYDQRTGQIKRKPANMRDIAKVSVDLLSKRELLRGNATERKESSQISVADQLKELALEFARWQNPTNKETIDVEMVEVLEDKESEDAVHDEWETGLQEGSGEIYVETGSSEEADGTECSPSEDGESRISPQG